MSVKMLSYLMQASLFKLSSFAAEDSGLKKRLDRRAIKTTDVTSYGFDPLDASDLAVTRAEAQRCRKWYDRHVRLTDGDAKEAAFSLKAGGRELRKHATDWVVTVGEESAEGAVYRHGKTAYTTLKHRRSELQITVEATIYEAYAACEWTVCVKNGGESASPVIAGLYGVDRMLPVGKSDLYVSAGSNSDFSDDFRLFRTPVNPLPMRMRANAGRNASFLPFFNLCGEKAGAVLCVGWTGQWMTSLSQRRDGVKARAGQETLRGALDGRETVRSARIALQFYDGGNPLKGFNRLRKWEADCVIPENITPLSVNNSINEFDRRTCDEFIRHVSTIPQNIVDQTDYIWMDAGWYTNTGEWYDTVGDWRPDPERFPQGMKPMTDAIHKRGLKFLLWYEPERCCTGTALYKEACKHAGWLLKRKHNDNVNMYNLASDDACAYLAEHIAKSLADNGVDIYRQDFNFDPLRDWERADKTLYGGRKGYEENHYVTGLYRYLDGLLSLVPDLMIDNCASGGKRLDIEMARRSIPLWRSDYNCARSDGSVNADVCEATQAQTFGLSCWLPFHGGNAMKSGEYADRTNILPCSMRAGYRELQKYLVQNYYPLADGGLAGDRILAMQFGTVSAGVALIYVRENVKAEEFTLRLNGLTGTGAYRLTDYDDPSFAVSADGKTLMTAGTAVRFTEKPKAKIILYSALGGN